MIVIARNPLEVIPSFANLANTQSHSLEINEQYHVDFPEIWWEWVSKMTGNIKKNHEDVYEDLARVLPTYFMRYEDLKLNPEPVLTELFCFLLNVTSLEGTVVEKRIQEVTQAGFSAQTAYKLKTTSNSLSRNRHMYSEA